jgi:FMN phosphatase YigB (HAD superfamily)
MRGVIALDIGGVCIQLRQQEFLHSLGLAAVPEELQALNIAFESGQIDADKWLKQCLGQVPSLRKIEPAAFWTAFRDIIGPDQPGMPELTKRWVDEGYQLIFFSNTSSVHAEEVWKKISFADRISGGVYSYEAGSMKPSPEIYRCFEERYGRPALYLDDNRANVEQGLKMGWPARLFTDAEVLLRELKA